MEDNIEDQMEDYGGDEERERSRAPFLSAAISGSQNPDLEQRAIEDARIQKDLLRTFEVVIEKYCALLNLNPDYGRYNAIQLRGNLHVEHVALMSLGKGNVLKYSVSYKLQNFFLL